MARVPVVTNSVQRGPMTDAKLRPADFGEAGEAIGRGMQQLGGAVSQYAEQQDRINEQFVEAAAKQALTEYTRESDAVLHTADNAYYRQQGQNALNARGDVEKRLNETFGAIQSRLTTPRMKRMFEDSAGQMRARDLVGVAGYAGKQADVWNNQQDSALQYQMAQSAIGAAVRGDEEAFAVAKGTMLNSIRSQAARSGLSGAPAQVVEAKAVSDMYAGIVGQMLTDDPVKANAYFLEHTADIGDQETREKLARALKAPLEEQEADEFASLFRGTAAPDADPEPDKPDAPHARISARWSSARLASVVHDIPGVRVTSLNRSKAHNAAVNGVPNSQHIGENANESTALDFVAPGMTLKQVQAKFAAAGASVKVLRHDAGSGDHFHVQGAKPARVAAAPSGGPKNAPRVNDLNAQLGAVDRYAAVNDWPYSRTQAVKNRLMQMDGIDNRLRIDREQAAYDSVTTTALQLGDGFRSVRQLGPAFANLSPQQQATMVNAARSNSRPAPVETDYPTLIALRELEATNPKAFARIDVMSYRGKLDKGDFENLIGRKAGAMSPDGKTASPVSVERSRLFNVSKDALQAAGVPTGDNKEGRAAAGRRVQFTDRMAALADAWTKQNPGKQPPDDVIRGWAGNLLLRAAGTPVFEATDVQVAQNIPLDMRNQIIRGLNRQGLPSRPSDVAEVWRRAAATNRFTR